MGLRSEGRLSTTGDSTSSVTLSQGFYHFSQESMALREHSCPTWMRCGVIGGQARGLLVGHGGTDCGLVTSRFRVCTDLIELATAFAKFATKLHGEVKRRAARIERSEELLTRRHGLFLLCCGR